MDNTEAEVLAELAVAEYILRNVSEAVAAAMFCGCRHCKATARSWVEWWAGDDSTPASAKTAEAGLE